MLQGTVKEEMRLVITEMFGIFKSILYRLRHLCRHLLNRRVREMIGLASRRYGISRFRIYHRLLSLYWSDRFLPVESLAFGLADPAVPPEQRRMCFSEERLHGWQIIINSPEAAVCRDKLIFHSYCVDHGLPVANLYGVISPFGSRTRSGKALVTERDWEDFRASVLPETVIVKPRGGNLGRDVRKLDIHENNFLADLKNLAADDEDWLIQECLVAHEEVEQLTGTGAISSLRIFTLISEQGDPEIMDAYFRVIAGKSVTDNISDSQSDMYTGNIVASPDSDTGRLVRAWTYDVDGVGYRMVDSHPVTGRCFANFTVPFWSEARDLVREAARKFIPIRTAGWDVAITSRGVVLIESNERFQNASIGPATERFRSALEAESRRLKAVSDRARRKYIGSRV